MKKYRFALPLLFTSIFAISGCATVYRVGVRPVLSVVRLPVEIVQLSAIAVKAPVNAVRRGHADTSPLATPLQLSIDYQKIAATRGSVTAVKSDGTLWVWGSFDKAAAGTKTREVEVKATPSQIPGVRGFNKIAAGRLHFIALNLDGTAWGWGDNQNGQLGSTRESSSPTVIEGLQGIVDIAANNQASLFLDREGQITLLGSYQDTWDAEKKYLDHFKPTVLWKDSHIRKISMTDDAIIAILDTGDAMIWDDDYVWRTNEARKNYDYDHQVFRRQDIHLDRPIISAIKNGGTYFFLLDNGLVMARGSNLGGSLGQGGLFSNLYMTSLPMRVDKFFQVKNLGHVVSMVPGKGRGAAAIDDKGRIWHWGDTFNISPLTGFEFTDIPKNEPKLEGITELHAVGGYSAFTSNGDVYFWGQFAKYMQGTGNGPDINVQRFNDKDAFVPVKSLWTWK